MSGRGRPARPTSRYYSRMARVNEVLREVLAEELEVLASADARLELVTVTAVSCEPDLRHATVLLASLPDTVREALGEVRPRLQAAIARQVRMKRTPQLSFQVDPAVGHGELVEEICASCAPAADYARTTRAPSRRRREQPTTQGMGPPPRTGTRPRTRPGARREALRARAPSRRCEPG